MSAIKYKTCIRFIFIVKKDAMQVYVFALSGLTMLKHFTLFLFEKRDLHYTILDALFKTP